MNSLPLTIPLYKGAEAAYRAGKSLYNTGKETITAAKEAKGLGWLNKPVDYENSSFWKSMHANPGWWGKAVLDVTTRPIGTYRAVKDGRYIYDFPSLKRNIESASKEIKSGMQSTNNEYLGLTGLTIPETTVHIKPWNFFKKGVGGFYNSDEKSIYIPLTLSRYSNIRRLNSILKHTGGHEQAHAASRYLHDQFSIPRLRVYSPTTKYFIPNKINPVADKYYDTFMRSPHYHGKSPEETWANYMGNIAEGEGNTAFLVDNYMREGIFPPNGFIHDYKDYLKNLNIKNP